MSVKELKMVTESICREVVVGSSNIVSHFSPKVLLVMGEADDWRYSSLQTSSSEKIVNEPQVSVTFCCCWQLLLLLTILIVVVDNSCFCWQFSLLLSILVGQARQSQQKRSSPHGPAPIGLNSLSKTFNIIKVVGQGDFLWLNIASSSGHFGKVFKVENKFDHRTFALKQIKIHPREDLDKVLQEVENLSKVNGKILRVKWNLTATRGVDKLVF